jgi:O-antigen/teichoic acid export membrane protein
VPLARTFSLLKPFHDEFKFSEVLRALPPYRREIKSCLVNSNLSGYLKLAISPGDLFLLGLFSSTTQVAWLGLAKQLIAPLAFLQTNIQTAVIPEISGLVAAAKFNQLKRLMRRYLYQMSVMGTIMLVMIVVVGRFLILNILPVEYAGALPAFYLLAIASSLMLAFLIFRPLALNLDLLRWHNLILLMSSIAAVGLILTGRLSALNIAWIQLGEVVILRSLFGFALYHRLRHS